MGPMNDQRPADGEVEQRRRYEIEEQDRGHFKTRAAMAFIIGNAIGLLKNIVYPDEASANHSGQAAAAESPPALAHANAIESATTSDLPTTSDEGERTENEEQPVYLGHGVSGRATRTFAQPRVDGDTKLNSSAAIPRPSNDNETLYGAKPGSNIAALSGDGSNLLAVAHPRGHGGGGGAPSNSDEDIPGSGSDSGPDSGSDFPRDTEVDGDQDDSDPQRPNRPSVVTRPVQLAGLFVNQSIIIGLSDLLAHASDPDGDHMTVRDLAASSGSLEDNSNGTWRYTPDHDDTSDVTFTYSISDGEASTPQTASLDLLPPAGSDIVGAQDADALVGASSSDTIASLSGNDGVHGHQGNDFIEGGDSDDRIGTGAGNDLVIAGAGNDVVFAGPGDDKILGGTGDDLLFGEEGDDEILGEDGDDTLSGGPGDDTLAGGTGDDDLQGGDGADLIDGGEGADKIDGGSGNDEVIAGAGADEALSGAGNDLFCATIGDGDDVYDGGADVDTYDLSATSADAVIDLAARITTSLETGNDHISSFEIVIGGKGNDVIIADDAANVLTGGPGDDTFVFRSAKSAGMGADARDKILDFDVGDKIDLSEIDKEFANTFGDALEDLGFHKFVLIQSGEAFTAPGQLRFSYELFDDREVTVVAGNIDGDTEAEFEIELYGHKDLKDEDFSAHEPQDSMP